MLITVILVSLAFPHTSSQDWVQVSARLTFARLSFISCAKSPVSNGCAGDGRFDDIDIVHCYSAASLI